MEAMLNWITRSGYAALFVLLMVGIVGAFIPDDLVLTFTGCLIFAGYLSLFPRFSALGQAACAVA